MNTPGTFFSPRMAQWLMSVLAAERGEKRGKGNQIDCRFAEGFGTQIKLNKLVRWTLHINQNNNLSYDFKQLLFSFFFSPFISCQVSEEQCRAVGMVSQLHFSGQIFERLHTVGSCQMLILTGDKIPCFSKTSAWVNYG